MASNPIGQSTQNLTVNLPLWLYDEINRRVAREGIGQGEYVRNALMCFIASGLKVSELLETTSIKHGTVEYKVTTVTVGAVGPVAKPAPHDCASIKPSPAIKAKHAAALKKRNQSKINETPKNPRKTPNK